MEGKRKRGPNGMGSIRKVSDKRYQGRVTVGYDEFGRQKVKSVYGKTQKEVRQKMTEIIQQVDSGNYTDPKKIKLSDWLDVWIAEYSNDKKYSTLKGYKAAIRNHIKPELGEYYLDELSPVLVQKFYNKLIMPTDGSKPLCAKTAKNIHITLHAALNQAIDNEILQKNPCDKTRLAKVEKKHIKPLTDEQIKEFIERCESDTYYGSILRVIAFTGLRESEAMGLTWDAVDFEKGHLIIDKQLMRKPKADGGTTLSSVKNGKPRVLAPAQYVMDTLKKRYLDQILQSKWAGSPWMAWKNEEEHKKALVFTNEIGDHLVQKRVYLHFKKIAVEIGAPEARVHDLRHTFAVISLQNGDDVKTVQENLGHSSASFTLDVYGHVSDRMKKESAARMENFIFSLSAQQ